MAAATAPHAPSASAEATAVAPPAFELTWMSAEAEAEAARIEPPGSGVLHTPVERPLSH